MSPGDRVEVFTDEAGEHRWRRVAGNNEIVADSGEGYSSKAAAVAAAEREAGEDAEVVVLDEGRVS